jgi:hypothetical protein
VNNNKLVTQTGGSMKVLWVESIPELWGFLSEELEVLEFS